MPRLFVVSILTLLLAARAMLTGQTTGAVEGTVRDPSAAAVAGALIRLEETSTGAVRQLASTPDGRYVALHLPPGRYEITVSHPGFRDQARAGVPIDAGLTAQIDFQLQLGEQRDTVIVTAENLPLDTRATEWGSTVTQQQIEQLPLNGRDLFDLASQQPGASIPLTADKGLSNGPGVKVSLNGARPNQNGFQLDGIRMNDVTSGAPASAAGRALGIESIRELRLVTSPFSAEYGRAAGGVLTAVSKSGGNEWHGSAYEFFRDEALDARNYFDSPDEEQPPLRRNQFGGLVSGPVRRNRAFFLVNYEGLRETVSQTVSPIVPNADARAGLLPAAGGGVNRIDVAPQVRPYLNLFPMPNGRDFGDGTGEFVNESVQSTREDYVATKLDLLVSPQLRLFGRYTLDDADTTTPDPLGLFRFLTGSAYHLAHTEAQYVPSPNTIYHLRFGFSRVRNQEIAATSVPGELAFIPGQQIGSIEVTGLTEFGGTRARTQPRRFIINDFQWNNDLAHVRGLHSLRLGGGISRVQFNQISDVAAVGRYQFSSLADFLQARTRSGDLMLPGSDTVRGWRQNQFFAYLQDEYRVSPALSFSLGVRYEAYSTPSEVNGKIGTLPDPLRDSSVTAGGPLFRNPSQNNFAPRASLAWDPLGSGRTVIRAGGGIFFDLLGTKEIVVAGVRMPPFFRRATLPQPAFPHLAQAAQSTTPLNALDALDFDLPQPYVAHFQLFAEHRLAADLVLRAGYAGSRGVHLVGQIGNVNVARPEVLPGGAVFFPAGAPRLNPAFASVGLRRAQFDSVYHSLLLSVERRWRHGLRVQTKYTWSKSIDNTSNAVITDFDNSDVMPVVFNYALNRGRSDFDVRHLFAANFSWQAPRRLGGWELHGLTQVQTGYPFSPTVGFDRARFLPTSGDGGQRPDFAASPETNVILGGPDRYFDPAAYVLPAAGFYGNLGRGTLAGPGLFVLDLAVHKTVWRRESQEVRLRFEAFNCTNRPNFSIPSDRLLFNSRLERLGTAGRITSTGTPARQVQLAVRYSF